MSCNNFLITIEKNLNLIYTLRILFIWILRNRNPLEVTPNAILAWYDIRNVQLYLAQHCISSVQLYLVEHCIRNVQLYLSGIRTHNVSGDRHR